MLLPKKDKRHNNYFDNYSNRVGETALSGLVMACIVGAIYVIYRLV